MNVLQGDKAANEGVKKLKEILEKKGAYHRSSVTTYHNPQGEATARFVTYRNGYVEVVINEIEAVVGINVTDVNTGRTNPMITLSRTLASNPEVVLQFVDEYIKLLSSK